MDIRYDRFNNRVFNHECYFCHEEFQQVYSGRTEESGYGDDRRQRSFLSPIGRSGVPDEELGPGWRVYKCPTCEAERNIVVPLVEEWIRRMSLLGE